MTIPEWVTALEDGEELKGKLYESVLNTCKKAGRMKQCRDAAEELQQLSYVQRAQVVGMDLAEGRVHIELALPTELFFEILKVLTAFIRPRVPIEMRSSVSSPVFSNFFTM